MPLMLTLGICRPLQMHFCCRPCSPSARMCAKYYNTDNWQELRDDIWIQGAGSKIKGWFRIPQWGSWKQNFLFGTPVLAVNMWCNDFTITSRCCRLYARSHLILYSGLENLFIVTWSYSFDFIKLQFLYSSIVLRSCGPILINIWSCCRVEFNLIISWFSLQISVSACSYSILDK